MDAKIKQEFIKKQQNLLLEEQIKIRANIEKLKGDDPFSDPDHASDNAAVDTDVREQLGHDTIEAEIKSLNKKLDDIVVSLKKIDDGEYGYCEKCHGQIPQARLELVPEAHFCVTCRDSS